MRFLILALSITFLSIIAISPAPAQNMRAFALMQQQAAQQQRAAQQQAAAQQGAARAAQLRALHPAYSQQPQGYSGATPGGSFGGGVSQMMQGMGLGLAPGQSAPPGGVSGMMQGMGLGLPPGATPVPGGIGGSVYGTAQPDYQGANVGGPGPGNPGNNSLEPQGVGSSIPAGYVDEGGSGAPPPPPFAGDGPPPSLSPDGPPPQGPQDGAVPQGPPHQGQPPPNNGEDGQNGPPPPHSGDRSEGGSPPSSSGDRSEGAPPPPVHPHGRGDKAEKPKTESAENVPSFPSPRSEKPAAESRPENVRSSESSSARAFGTTGGDAFGEASNGSRSKFGDAFFGAGSPPAAAGSGAEGSAPALSAPPVVSPLSGSDPTAANAVVRRQPGWANAFNKIPSTVFVMDEPAPNSRPQIQPGQIRLQRR